MKFLNSILNEDAGFRRISTAIQKNDLPAAVSGVSRIHAAAITAALREKTRGTRVIITADEAGANYIYDDLVRLGEQPVIFSPRDFAFGDIIGASRQYEQKRIHTLSRLLDGAFSMLICPVGAAVQRTIPPTALRENSFSLKNSETVDLGEIISRLTSAGYSRCDMVDGIGQFSVRGGIVDIFAANSSEPIRIELWGDEIDSISYFDTDTQRRGETLDSVVITPASEVLCDNDTLIELLTQFRDNKRGITDKYVQRLSRDIDLLRGGAQVNIDRYAPIIYGELCTVLDYIKDPVYFLLESGNIEEHLDRIRLMENEDIKNAFEEGFLGKGCDTFTLSEAQFFERCEQGIIMDSFARGKYPLSPKSLIDLNWKRSCVWNGDVGVLIEDIEYILEKGGSAVVLAGEQRAAKVLCSELNSKGINARLDYDCSEAARGVTVTCGGLSNGLELPDEKFLLITHRHILGEKKKSRSRPKNAKEIGSIEELKRGDYVVHTAHGIGVFDGIHRISSGGVTKDYIKINYAKSDVLYVPVTQLDLVSKYIGSADNGQIKVHKLGGSEWSRTRSRVRAAVKDMAKQLTTLYAKRMSAKGYAFAPDTDLQSDFERRFPYDETEDQLRCINEIKGDMERAVPMDRLLCGDVGFGKTEVALRAAFKCVSEGKQGALLVPTTILAWQHYNTVLQRFADMPLSVEMLSRFVTKTRQEKTLRGLKNGTVDMVIGTHRMISNDVNFRDLGLVIIDEEQRFGVAQKERLKEKYPQVDVLTLSATPIPRTLNMAMSGLRDMSSIDEAPGDRHPVQTYVLEHNAGLLADAINKELRRGGQVYYLHNRVETIVRCAARLQAQLPEGTRIATAHGKMSEDELSAVWRRLMEHEIDVLVCTTIIETGVDVANVNTLIIEDADRMGLAQLHQLRGRVGRSPRRAYAYFCFRGGRQLSEIATKRLEAIREYTEFGSGFKIAMRDLEIRGAGSILGGEQHGNMEAVGYDMYLKLLADAINEEKGLKVKEELPCTVDLNISAHIPPEYISSLPARLGIYRRIAEVKNEDGASDVLDELIDRFGEPPVSVMGLINISLLRTNAAAAGIYEINGSADGIHLNVTGIDPKLLSMLSAHFGNRVYVKGTGEKPYYLIKMKTGQTAPRLISELIPVLEQIVKNS